MTHGCFTGAAGDMACVGAAFVVVIVSGFGPTDGDSFHTARAIAANMKRKTLPPRTLGSVLGLMPCLQESRARLRNTRASPKKAVFSLPASPPSNKRQPTPPATSATEPKFVLAGVQNEYFCVC